MSKWPKGVSGNPKGSMPGRVTKSTELRKQLETHAPEVFAKVVAMAKKGDTAAMRIFCDRVLSPIKANSIPIQADIPAGTLAEQAAAIFREATGGKLSTDDAAALMAVLSGRVRIVELTEILQRIEALETKKGEKHD